MDKRGRTPSTDNFLFFDINTVLPCNKGLNIYTIDIIFSKASINKLYHMSFTPHTQRNLFTEKLFIPHSVIIISIANSR